MSRTSLFVPVCAALSCPVLCFAVCAVLWIDCLIWCVSVSFREEAVWEEGYSVRNRNRNRNRSRRRKVAASYWIILSSAEESMVRTISSIRDMKDEREEEEVEGGDEFVLKKGEALRFKTMRGSSSTPKSTGNLETSEARPRHMMTKTR